MYKYNLETLQIRLTAIGARNRLPDYRYKDFILVYDSGAFASRTDKNQFGLGLQVPCWWRLNPRYQIKAVMCAHEPTTRAPTGHLQYQAVTVPSS